MKALFNAYRSSRIDRNLAIRSRSLQVESLEGRRLLAVVQPGDANLDFHFDAADIVQVFQVAKFENNEPANWAEGDWNGGPGEDGPTMGDGVFSSQDLITAFTAGAFDNGPYDAEAGEAVHNRMPLSQAGAADVTIVYDSGNGAIRVDSNFALTTFNMESQSGKFNFNGPRPAPFSSPFDVARASELLILKANGASTLQFGTITEAGLTEAELTSDLLVDGSRLGGGDLGNVQLTVCNDCVLPDPPPRVNPADAVNIDLTYDSVTGEIFVESPVPITSLEIISQGSKLTGDRPEILSGRFDVFVADKLFKLNSAGNSDFILVR
ncbi:hypothetical protein ACFL2H_13370 [Planctomycetota bacterium]